jgi:hypothetical protein
MLLVCVICVCVLHLIRNLQEHKLKGNKKNAYSRSGKSIIAAAAIASGIETTKFRLLALIIVFALVFFIIISLFFQIKNKLY